MATPVLGRVCPGFVGITYRKGGGSVGLFVCLTHWLLKSRVDPTLACRGGEQAKSVCFCDGKYLEPLFPSSETKQDEEQSTIPVTRLAWCTGLTRTIAMVKAELILLFCCLCAVTGKFAIDTHGKGQVTRRVSPRGGSDSGTLATHLLARWLISSGTVVRLLTCVRY